MNWFMCCYAQIILKKLDKRFMFYISTCAPRTSLYVATNFKQILRRGRVTSSFLHLSVLLFGEFSEALWHLCVENILKILGCQIQTVKKNRPRRSQKIYDSVEEGILWRNVQKNGETSLYILYIYIIKCTFGLLFTFFVFLGPQKSNYGHSLYI